MLGGVLADVFADLHRAEVRAAHGAEMGGFGTVLGESFVVIEAGGDGIEAEVKLVFPTEFEAGLAEGVVAVLGAGVAFGEVRSVGGELVGDDTDFDIVLVRKAEVFLGRDVAEHGAAIPADHGGTDAAGDVVVAGGDVGGQWSEGVEGGFVAPLELLGHVFLDHVHRDVAGAFVHDLAALGPGTGGELALDFEFAELGFVIGIGDGAGAEAVADGEADIVGGADVADFIPVGVEEVFLVMGEAPLGHDRAAAGDDAGHAAGGHGDEAQQDTGVDGEVIDALLGLLDEGVAIEFPSEILGLAVDLFQRLIDRHGADGDGGVSQDPLAGGVDVLAGGKVHHGVRAPLGGPAHFFHFLFDGRGDGGVADVGVDFHEEIPADDHRFAFRVVDVERDDRAASGDLAADELGGDLGGDALWEAFENAGSVGAVRILGGALVLLVEVVADDVVGHVRDFCAAHVFADGDELHLWGDDALAGVVELGDWGDTCGRDAHTPRAEGLAAVGGEAGELDEFVGSLGLRGEFRVFFGEVAVVLRLDFAAVVGFYIAAGENPVAAEWWETFFGSAFEIGITPWTGAVIDADGLVFFDATVEGLGVGEGNLAHWDPDLREELALHIDAGGGG